MSQDFQSIGSASPDLERVANQHKGWGVGPLGDPTPQESLIDQVTDSGDYSEWDERTNRHMLGLRIPHMAGYQEPSTAAYKVTPAANAHPDDN